MAIHSKLQEKLIREVLYPQGLIGGGRVIPYRPTNLDAEGFDRDIIIPGWAHLSQPDDWFVDPGGGSDSTGDGSIGNPWKTVQHALDTCTRNTTNGDRINIKAGTDDVLTSTLSLSTYGTPLYSAPLIFQGYTSAQGDGGKGGIDGNGSSIFDGNYDGVGFIDLHLHNAGSSIVVRSGQRSAVIRCEVDNSSGDGIYFYGSYATAAGCHIHNIGGVGINMGSTYSMVIGNYLKNGTNKFTRAISLVGNTSTALFNIISVDGNSIGIRHVAQYGLVAFNSILSAGGTGWGINYSGSSTLIDRTFGNLIEGFSGVGGWGIYYVGDGNRINPIQAWNYLYNNTTSFTNFPGVKTCLKEENTILSGSPFMKTGSDTFANRFNYFAPTADVRDKIFAET